jgi:branched-chain amino acid transport system permease protein
VSTGAQPGGLARREVLTRPRAVLASLRSELFIAIFGLLALLVIPSIADAFWLKSCIAAVIFSIAAGGGGLLYGRVGMVSLCQMSLVGVGGWICLRLAYSTSLPFPVLLLISGAATAVVGVFIGLPALRMTGLYLALITLMAAGAFEVIFQATGFPNGGRGVLGLVGGFQLGGTMRRPGIAESDAAFFRYAVVVAAILFMLALAHLRTRPGRAWTAIRQSEAAALSCGVNVTLYRLWAFALASFVTGIAGGLYVASIGSLDWGAVSAEQSILLFAAILMGGAYSLFGAVVAGALLQLLPTLFDSLNLSGNLVLILFGIGVVQVLATAPAGMAGQIKDGLTALHALTARKIAHA